MRNGRSSMNTYKAYHTNLKQLAKRGCLPDCYEQEIDRSTIWRWKQEENDKYFGSELSNIEILDQFISRKEAQKLMRSYLKVAYSISHILNKTNLLHSSLKNNLTQFVRIIIRYKNDIDLKILLRLCRVPLSVFYSWKNKVLNPCLTSPIQLCKKRYPNQLTANETVLMKEMLTDEKYKFWPISSIAYYALREKLLSVSLATWYLYKKKLGIKRLRFPQKIRYPTGIRASYPDQIWHADITIVKTKDGKKHYAYLLMDNFSRFILSWRIEEIVSAIIRIDTIREAYLKYKKASKSITLVTDGGPENDNKLMSEFVKNETEDFNTTIALQDIPFSNSMVEAQNKLFKYRYLFRQYYDTGDDLKRIFAEDVNDYNFIRPHISLNGYTPSESHSGLSGMESVWSDQIKQAQKERLAVNKTELCGICQ